MGAVLSDEYLASMGLDLGTLGTEGLKEGLFASGMTTDEQ